MKKSEWAIPISAHGLSSPINDPVRFVLISDGPLIHRWEHRCLSELVDCEFGVLAGVIYTRGSSATVSAKSNDSLQKFSALADRFSRALKYVEIDALAKDVPILDRAANNLERFESEAPKFAAAIAPHFLLVLGSSDSGLAYRLAKLARWGAWSYRFGEALSPLPQSAVLAATLSGCSTVAAALVMTLSGERVLHNGVVGTSPAKLAKTVDQLCFSITPWLRRTCFDMAKNGFAESRFLETGAVPVEPRSTLGTAFRLSRGVGCRFVRTLAEYKLSRQYWNVGVIRAPISTVAGLDGPEAQAQALSRIQWMPEENGRYFADPFGYETSPGNFRVLFELFEYARGRGSIAIRDFDGCTFGDIRIVLDAQTHLSYPFVVSLNDEPHYIPEHAQARDVSAFSLDKSGKTVEKKILIPKVELLDCTFFEGDNKFWMFAIEDRHAKNAELYLFYSDQIDGEWRGHPLNPVKTDLRSARPGGTPFIHKGKLFRPSQDCTTHYGCAVVINEITVLSETDFAESPVSRIDPPADSRYSYGLHTISQVNGVTFIDGARKKRRWSP